MCSYCTHIEDKKQIYTRTQLPTYGGQETNLYKNTRLCSGQYFLIYVVFLMILGRREIVITKSVLLLPMRKLLQTRMICVE